MPKLVPSARTLIRTASLAALGVAAWEVQRRRDLRDVRADPEWGELNRDIAGRTQWVEAHDGTRIHAQVFGPADAPTIVLVHGWVCDISFWHYQIRDLSRFFRVVAYDQRGHGRSDVPEDDSCYTADTLAADLQAVLDACVPEGSRCVVAGHSMGGMTVVAWAGRHPRDVQRRLAGAALVNTGMSELVARALVLGPRAGTRVHRAIAPLATLQRGFSTAFEPVSFRLIRHIVATPQTSTGRVAFLHRMVLGAPAPVRAGFGRLFNDLDLSESVPDLTVPTVVIAGEKDRLLPPWHSLQLADRLPQLVEMTVLPGIAHMAPVEAPAEITQRLRQLAADTLSPARSPAYAS